MIPATTSLCGSIQIYQSYITSENPQKLGSRKFFSKRNLPFVLGALVAPSPVCAKPKKCECFDLYNELVPYDEAWSWQKNIVKQKKELIERNEESSDALIILQHYPVYTLGSGSSEEYLNFDIKDPPYNVYRTERGGEVTYHGPGQLVMYPIINLRNHRMDLHWYLRALEEVVIRVLSSAFGIEASRHEGLTGVWVGDEKLAAIGIRVSQWITYHGLALNVTNDLAPFQKIVPCGIRNRGVASVKGLLEVQSSTGCRTPEKPHTEDLQLMDIAHESFVREFSKLFQLELDIHTRTPSGLPLKGADKHILRQE